MPIELAPGFWNKANRLATKKAVQNYGWNDDPNVRRLGYDRLEQALNALIRLGCSASIKTAWEEIANDSANSAFIASVATLLSMSSYVSDEGITLVSLVCPDEKNKRLIPWEYIIWEDTGNTIEGMLGFAEMLERIAVKIRDSVASKRRKRSSKKGPAHA
jgi:hypothetical protein